MDFQPNSQIPFGTILDELHGKSGQLVLVRPHQAMQGGMFLLGILQNSRLTIERPWVRLSLLSALIHLGTRKSSGWGAPLGGYRDEGCIDIEISQLLAGDQRVIQAILRLSPEDAHPIITTSRQLGRPVWEHISNPDQLDELRSLLPKLIRLVQSILRTQREQLRRAAPMDHEDRCQLLARQLEETRYLSLYLSLAYSLNVTDPLIRKLQAFYGACIP